MEVASLAIAIVSAVVAVLAVVAAGASARHAGRSAEEAKRVADIDEQRRHDERVPRIEARYGTTRWAARQTSDVPVVWFDFLEIPAALTSARVELMMRAEAKEPPIVEIAPAENDQQQGRTADFACPIRAGEERLVVVTKHPNDPGGTAAFNVTCTIASGETWGVPVRCGVPTPPRVW